MKKIEYYNLREVIEKKIKEKGGWVNTHAHIDRAYTITKENFHLYNLQRHEKWKINAELRRSSTVSQIYDRMAMAVEKMIEQGVTALGTFIDVDYDVKDKAIKAAIKIRDTYKSQITIKYQNQSSYGLLTKEAREWFEVGADFVDIIGGLLKADKGRDYEHLDILLDGAKKRNKTVICHLDELNLEEEKETELICNKIMEHGMQGKVTGIHGISINAHKKDYREKLYNLMKKADLNFISCPISWLDARRNENQTPTHNPITPIDEMIPHGLIVGIGTDNIADIWKPFNDADMWTDLRVLLEAARFTDIDALVDIATINGRKILGIQ